MSVNYLVNNRSDVINFFKNPREYLATLYSSQMNLVKKICLYVFAVVFCVPALFSSVCFQKICARKLPAPIPVDPKNAELIDGVAVPESIVNGRSFLEQYIDGIYVLNCPGSVERGAQADRELRKLGAPTYCRFNAYMGRKLNSGVVYNLQTKDRSYPLDFEYFAKKASPGIRSFALREGYDVDKFMQGTVGCYISHLEIVKDAKRKRLKQIIIFEDDVHFRDPKAFSLHLQTALKQGLPEDAGICFLFYGREGMQLQDLPQENPLKGVIAKVEKYSCGQAAYIVTEKAYDALIERWTDPLDPSKRDVLWESSDMGIKKIIASPPKSRPFETYALTLEARASISVQGESLIATKTKV